MNPEQILNNIRCRAENLLEDSVISNQLIKERVDYVCRCMSNRAGVRLLMSCLLGKLDKPNVDPRKPYTEIGGTDCFSGRTYDERYLTKFINDLKLPVNHTTAFLTPTLRNINRPLTTDRELIGRPRNLYIKTLELLEDVAEKRIDADILFIEVVRLLLVLRNEHQARITSLLDAIHISDGCLPLSSEAIIALISQHLACKNASRLPVLVVAAAYNSAGKMLSENIVPLNSHNAADLQTGSLGDIEICITNDNSIVTVYEMKMRRITYEDIDSAINKIAKSKNKINNYLFITTDKISQDVSEYAATFYERTDGIEVAILDCIGFLRYFLHLFHRIRVDYLNAYQELVLNEPDSSVSQILKEAFLVLRRTAESGE